MNLNVYICLIYDVHVFMITNTRWACSHWVLYDSYDFHKYTYNVSPTHKYLPNSKCIAGVE